MIGEDDNLGDSANPLTAAIFQRDADIIDMVRKGLMTNNVTLHYQPVVQSADPRSPAFFEGLVRVLDDTGRVIPAREFISTIEAQAEGRQIDCLALSLGLQSLRQIPNLRLSINMSARSIGHSAWMEALDRGLHNNPTAAERLIIEITESSAFENPDKVCDFMGEINALGCAFALDDFGAGNTSFRYFKDFLFDIVKIDGDFIRGIHCDADNQVLTDALVMIAKQFDMFTVAEYVEAKRDADYLITAGVDCLQGYLFGAPAASPRMPALNLGQRSA
jgi:EAL domain-containing protein (putative c-di-GMP-specific phosphodiesterase class I)